MSLMKCHDQLLNAAMKFNGKHNTQTSSSAATMLSQTAHVSGGSTIKF